MSDRSLKMLSWHVTEKATLTCNGKGYSDVSLKSLRWWVTGHSKGSIDMFLLNYEWIYYSLLEPIKACHEKRSIHTPTSQTMCSKEHEPWSPRWVRQKLREMNNGLVPNDLNHDEKPSADVERPLCKCDLDCQSHMSIDYDMYDRRYWSCPLLTSLFNWGWDEEKPRKVLSVVTLKVYS
jgi:hypothetical protein